MISHLEGRTITCAWKQSTDENNDMAWILRQSRCLISGKGMRFLVRNVQTGC